MMSGSVIGNYIVKIQQLLGSNDKKQKQMSTQQCLHNQQLFDMSIQLFKQTLEIDEVSFEQYIHDQKFIAYIKCIERIGLTLSGHYLERQKDHLHQIESLKLKYNDLHQKLTQHMDQNYDLKAMLDHYENQRKIYDEELNKSQHEIQRGKHQIFNEHKTKQLLQFENEKLTITNQDLIKQNANLQSQIDKLNKQLSQTIQESKQLKQKLTEIKTSLEAAQLQINNLKEQKFCLQKQNESLNLLLQQKDYLLGNKIDKEKQEIPLSAQHNYPYFVRSIKVVRQENQHEEEYCSDKEVLKDIQEEYRPQEHIMILDFGKSISCSEDRDQTTSIKVQVIEGLGESEQQQEENIITTQKNDVKLRPMKSDRKKKETAQKQVPINRSMAKIQTKLKSKQSSKLPQTPKFKQPITKQKSLTSKIKRFNCESQERSSKSIIRHKNVSAQHKYIPRSNASVILNTKTQNYELSQFALNTKRGKIQYSHSVQDFSCENDLELNERQILFQKELMTKQKMIQNLKFQNRSVRRLAQQESQKRTQAQLQYEQSLQKLNSQLTFYKEEIKKVFSQFIQEKALSKAYQNQFVQVSQQFQSQKNLYQKTARELRQKCIQEVERHRMMYEQKYEQILRQMMKMQEQMREMQRIISNHNSSNSGNDSNNGSSGNKSSNNSGNKNENQQNQTPQIRSEQQSRVQYQQQSGQLTKQLISPRSQQSLFPRQIKHHSHNASQQYSEINHLSRGDSKNTSVLMIDQEGDYEEKEQRLINIRDYEGVFQEQQQEEQLIYQQEQGLYSYRGVQVQYFDIGVQTNYELLQQLQEQEQQEQKITLEYSQNYNIQNEQQQASYELTTLVGMKSLQHSNIRPVQELSQNKEQENENKLLRLSYNNQIFQVSINGSLLMEEKQQYIQLQSSTIELQTKVNQPTATQSNINESTMNQPSTIQHTTQISIIQGKQKHKNYVQLLQIQSLLNVKVQSQIQKEQKYTQTIKKTMVLEKLQQISIKPIKEQQIYIQTIDMQTQTNIDRNKPTLEINNQMIELSILPFHKMVQNAFIQYQVLPQCTKQSQCQYQIPQFITVCIQSSPELKQTSMQTNQILRQQTQIQTLTQMISVDSQTSLPNLEIKSKVSQQTVDQIKIKQNKQTQSIVFEFNQMQIQTQFQQFLTFTQVQTQSNQYQTTYIQTQSLLTTCESIIQTQRFSLQQIQVQTQQEIKTQTLSIVQLKSIDIQTECQSIIQTHTQTQQQQKIINISIQQTIKETKQQETQTLSSQLLNIIEIMTQSQSYETQTQTKLLDTYQTQTQIYTSSNINVQTYNQQLTQSIQTQTKQFTNFNTQTEKQHNQSIDYQMQAYIIPNCIYQVQTQYTAVQNYYTQTQIKTINYQQMQTQIQQKQTQQIQTQFILRESQLIQTQTNKQNDSKVQTQFVKLQQIQIQTEHKQLKSYQIQTQNKLLQSCQIQTQQKTTNQFQIQTQQKTTNQFQIQTDSIDKKVQYCGVQTQNKQINSQYVQTQQKQIKYYQVQTQQQQKEQLKIVQVQTQFTQFEDNSIQTQFKQIQDINIQTQNKQITNYQTQTQTIQLQNIQSQTQPKQINSIQSQTQPNKLHTQHQIFVQTIYPTLRQVKRQQKLSLSQSKNSSIIDQMLMELSESMDMGEGFIQLVKRKLYIIMDNLQQLQQQDIQNQQQQQSVQKEQQSSMKYHTEQKAHHSDQESQLIQQKLSQQSLLSKQDQHEQQFNIKSKKDIKQLLSTHHQSYKTQQQHHQTYVISKPHSSFQGNTKQSKASTSTSSSLAMSLSFQSPSLINKNNQNNEDNKMKISSFQTIQQIQTEKYQQSILKVVQQQKLKQKISQLQVRNERVKYIEYKNERVQFVEYNRDYDSNYSGSVNRSQEQQDIIVTQNKQQSIMSIDKDNRLFQPQVQVQKFTLKPQISINYQTQRQQRRQKQQYKHRQLCKVIKQLYDDEPKPKQQQSQLEKVQDSQVRHKHLKRNRTNNRLSKPIQLDFMTQQQFKVLISEYKVKRMKLKQSTNQSMQINGDNQLERLNVNELLKNELLIIKCWSKQQSDKQNQSPNNSARYEQINDNNNKRDIIVLTQSKLLSLYNNYSFTAHKQIQHNNQQQLILGNQQIRLSLQQLKLSMNNKLNYFLAYQPKSICYNQMQSIKSSKFNVQSIYKYKIN